MPEFRLLDRRIAVTASNSATGRAIVDNLRAFAPHGAVYRLTEGADSDPLAVPAPSDPRFVSRLVEHCRQIGFDLILPSSDEALLPLARARHRFSAVGCRVAVPSAAALAKCQDPHALHCALNGLVPTVTTTLWDGTVDPRVLQYPVVARPRTADAGGQEVLVHDADSLARLANDGSQIVWHHLPGPRYAVDVFRSRSGYVHAAVPQHYPADQDGRPLPARTIREPALARSAVAVTEELGLFGPAHIRYQRGFAGEFRVIEVRPRLSESCRLVREAGIDLVWHTVADALGIAVPAVPQTFELVSRRPPLSVV